MFDTAKGSDYLADQDMVEILAKEAPAAIVMLERMGVPFSRNAAGKI
jgi:succinate dehydrogenase / fumarate reductase flavoprotein subunit